MQRQLMDELIAWKSRANRKPLLLKGARQTGKTWLLNEFAGQQYQNVIRFDFMLEPDARSLFDGSLVHMGHGFGDHFSGFVAGDVAMALEILAVDALDDTGVGQFDDGLVSPAVRRDIDKGIRG